MQIHLQRIVGAYVGSAHGAGQFYSRAVTEARDATAKLANDSRDEDLDGPVGFDSAAQRKREFAADMALQAHALRMAAEGAVTAYEQIVGETWKPFERQIEHAGETVGREGRRASDGGLSASHSGGALAPPFSLLDEKAGPRGPAFSHVTRGGGAQSESK